MVFIHGGFFSRGGSEDRYLGFNLFDGAAMAESGHAVVISINYRVAALGFMAHGGQGCISVTSNVAPKLCAQFQNACQQGNYSAALMLQDKLVHLHKNLFLENNPGGVKYAASRLGLCRNEFRLPLTPISKANEQAIDFALSHAGLLPN